MILFTPNLLPWLNDEMFIHKILKKISHTSKAKLENGSPVVYDVMCACVDGIAPEEHYGTFHEQPATKGISFLHLPSYKAFGHTDLQPSKETDSRAESLPSTIPAAIEFGKSHNQNRPDRVTVPLANTIFQNGKTSFLQHTRWDAQDGKFILRQKWDDKHFASIFAFSGIDGPLLTFLPARPVTPFRTIESGMGNIVREICFGEDDVGPASRELETVVSEISNSLGGSAVDIWALLVPNEVVSAVAENVPEHGPEYVGFWLNKGATMCRVVSGGGGWGPKQGLLSLDPQTKYDTTEVSSGIPGEQDVTSLGNLAQPGASIQFLAVDKDLPPPIPGRKVQPISQRKSIVFGTIPSTIDEIPNVSSEEQKPKYTSRVGHFGCVSGSGIFYRHDRPKPKEDTKVDAGSKSPEEPDPNQEVHSTLIHSKIDLPYSYVYIDGRIAQRRAQNATAKEPLRVRRVLMEERNSRKFSKRAYIYSKILYLRNKKENPRNKVSFLA